MDHLIVKHIANHPRMQTTADWLLLYLRLKPGRFLPKVNLRTRKFLWPSSVEKSKWKEGTASDKLCPAGANDTVGALRDRAKANLARGLEVEHVQNEIPTAVNI